MLELSAEMDIAKPETHQIDTSNILFILSGAFEGLPKIINSRMAKGVSYPTRSFHPSGPHTPVTVHWLHSQPETGH